MTAADFALSAWIEQLPDEPTPALDVGDLVAPSVELWQRAVSAALDPFAPADDLVDLVPDTAAVTTMPEMQITGFDTLIDDPHTAPWDAAAGPDAEFIEDHPTHDDHHDW